jgi:GntR family transcriptional regulator of vanillate catabolism
LEGLAARRAVERGVNPLLLRSMALLFAKIDPFLARPAMSHNDMAASSHLSEIFHFQIAQACGGQTVPRLIERVASAPFAHPWDLYWRSRTHRCGLLLELAQDQHLEWAPYRLRASPNAGG